VDEGVSVRKVAEINVLRSFKGQHPTVPEIRAATPKDRDLGTQVIHPGNLRGLQDRERTIVTVRSLCQLGCGRSPPVTLDPQKPHNVRD